MVRCVLLDGTEIEIKSLKEINERGIGDQIKELNCVGSQLKTLKGLDKCVNLRSLCCENNQLKTLEGLEKCINLQELFCDYNHLRTFKGLENCVNLREFNCPYNKLKTLKGLENCVILRKINCHDNRLRTLEGLEKCKNLQELNCVYNLVGYNDIDGLMNNRSYNITKNLIEFKKLYMKMTTEEMDIYHDYLKGKEKILIKHNYDNFKKCQYFLDHKKELVERYNLVEFYNEIYLKKQKTVEGCAICCDNKFIQYIKCQNNHVICRECYDLCQNKRLCCVCRNEYQIKNMYYEKLKN